MFRAPSGLLVAATKGAPERILSLCDLIAAERGSWDDRMTGYGRSLGPGADVEHARAVALVVSIIVSAALTGALSGLKTWAARVIPLISIASAALFMQTSTLAGIIQVAPLHFDDWVAAAGGGVIPDAFAALFRRSRAGLKPSSAAPSS